MEKNECISSRIRLAREQSGLSQRQLAKLMSMHRPSISEIEAGRRKVSASELSALAKYLKVDLAWLACEDSETASLKDTKIQLIARELSKLNEEDMDRLLSLLRRSGGESIEQ